MSLWLRSVLNMGRKRFKDQILCQILGACTVLGAKQIGLLEGKEADIVVEKSAVDKFHGMMKISRKLADEIIDMEMWDWFYLRSHQAKEYSSIRIYFYNGLDFFLSLEVKRYLIPIHCGFQI